MELMKQAREKKGFSLELMAVKLNISFYTYKYWETGTRKPSTERLKQIAEILETTIDKIA